MSTAALVRARLYDRLLARSERAGLRAQRAELLRAAHGQVLEIGAGTGLNLPHYPPGVALTLTEPDAAMRRRLHERTRGAIEIVAAVAEDLPFPNASFDTVVSTLVLCSVDDPAQTLAEIRRVLRRDGALLLLEHVRSSDPRLARLQDIFEPPWRLLSGGCRCNRSTRNELIAAGFNTAAIRDDHLPSVPVLVRPLLFGPSLADGTSVSAR